MFREEYLKVKSLNNLEKFILFTVMFYALFSTIDDGIINISNGLTIIAFIFYKKKEKPKGNRILDLVLISYGVFLLINFIFKSDGNFKGSIMIKFLGPIALYFVIRSIEFLKGYFYIILSLALSSMLISILYSFLQKLKGENRVHSFIFVMEFAEFAAMFSIFFIIVSLLNKDINIKYKIISWVLALVGFLSMLFTVTRGVWVAYFILIFIILLFLKKIKTVIVFSFVILLFLLISFKSNVFNGNKYVKRLKSITNLESNDSNTTRLRLWKSSFAIIKDNYIFGVGLNNFFKEIEKNKYKYGKIVSKSHAHNNYLQIGVLTGVLGVSFLIFIHLFILWILIRQYSNKENLELKLINLALFAFIFLYVFHGLTEVTIEDIYTSRLIWSLFALASLKNNLEGEVV